MKTATYTQLLELSHNSLPDFETYLENCGITKEQHRQTKINIKLIRTHKVLPRFSTTKKRTLIVKDSQSIANRTHKVTLTVEQNEIFILRSDLRALTEQLHLVKS